MNRFLKYIFTLAGATLLLPAVAQESEAVVASKDATPKVNVAYRQVDEPLASSQIGVVDAVESQQYDTRNGVNSLYNGKVTGFLNGANLRGFGTVVYVVDGVVVRDVNYLDVRDVKDVTILKDAASRVLYGVDAQTAIVQITTRRGADIGHHIGVTFEYGVNQATAYPDFLDAASYKTMYNQALRGDSYPEIYDTDEITNTASGKYPYLYPDNDYYGDMFVNSVVPTASVNAEAYGGNENAQYFVNMGWMHEDDWIAMGNYNRDQFSIRGNVDYKVNEWLSMDANVWAVFDSKKIPSSEVDFYNQANTYLPTLGPLLIPVNYIGNKDSFGKIPTVFGDFVLGGSSLCYDGEDSTYRNLIGDLISKGGKTNLSRHLTFSTGVTLDLSSITEGLSARAALSYDFFNQYSSYPKNSYSVFTIVGENDDNTFEVGQIGTDSKTTANTVDGGYFYRDFNINSHINYDRTFGDHHINAVALFSLQTESQSFSWQNNKRLTFGAQATYSFQNRFLVDAGFATVGSSKLPEASRFGTSPAVSATWVISNEAFMDDVDWLDSFKLNAGWGRLLNDKWSLGNYSGYFLYDTIYSANKDFTYGNGLYSSESMKINTIGSGITWQQRNETNIGVQATMLDNRLAVEANIFESHEKDIVTEMVNSNPGTIGDFGFFANNNAVRRRGYEIGVSFSDQMGDFKYSISSNMVYTSNIRTAYDEGMNQPEWLSNLGLSTATMRGLVADGVYMPTDFNSEGDLKGGYPIPSWGAVKDGDIRYIDQNNDMVINEDDVVNLGLNSNNVQYAVNLNLGYKNFTLFAQGIGQAGGRGMKNGDYYWINGSNAKYSSQVLGAYDSNSPEKYPAYPRLSTNDNSHNFRNSTFWLYDRDYFNLAALQLSYNMKFNSAKGTKNLQLYLRGENLLTIAKDKEILQLNIGSEPQFRTYAVGAVYHF